MHSKKSTAGAHGISAGDLARLDTWTVEIAANYLGTVSKEANGDHRAGPNRALIVHPNGCWHDFAADKSGHGALSLLVHLIGGDEQSVADAARTWLSQHEGDGGLGRANGDDEEEGAEEIAADDAQRTAYVETLWTHAGPIADTPGEDYLKSRSLDPVATGATTQLRWLANCRGDEGAMLAAITDKAGALVALQMNHITPGGQKSTVQPVRKTFRGPMIGKAAAPFGSALRGPRILSSPKVSRTR
jgi:hypothetical protein